MSAQFKVSPKVKRVVIAIGVVMLAFIALGLIQYSIRPRIVAQAVARQTDDTTGVVKSTDETPIASSQSMKWVTVALADGSEVRAGVVPGCIVHTGDTVRVRSLGAEGLKQRMYLVLGST